MIPGRARRQSGRGGNRSPTTVGGAVKIIADTPDQLILGDRPWLLGLGITLIAVTILFILAMNLMRGAVADAGWAGLSFLFVFGAFVAFVRRTVVYLDRTSGRVVVRVASVFGSHETGAALTEVVQAEVQTNPVKSTRLYTHRPILRLRSGDILVLRQVYVGNRSAEVAVGRINDWLARGTGHTAR